MNSFIFHKTFKIYFICILIDNDLKILNFKHDKWTSQYIQLDLKQ